VAISDVNLLNALTSSNCALLGTGTVYTDVDTNNNGVISNAEAAAVTTLDLHSKGIVNISVVGFVNVKHLDCSDNPIQAFSPDNFPALLSFSIQNCTLITQLFFSSSIISAVNLQGCTGMATLYCYSTSLNTLNLQGLPNLTTVYLQYMSLSNLDMQSLTNLNYLYLYDMVALDTLHVQGLANLRDLNINNVPFVDGVLDLQGLTGLKTLNCINAQVTSFTTLPNTLEIFTCDNNPHLSCIPNLPDSLRLTHWSMSNSAFSFANTMLNCLPSYNNYITATNSPLPLCTANSPCTLGYIDIPDANFKYALLNTSCVDTNNDSTFDTDADTNNDGQIQVLEALAVKSLNIAGRQIDSLVGLSHFIYIEKLNCSQNNLLKLETEALDSLVILNCADNQLLDLPLLPNRLRDFSCANNININCLTNIPDSLSFANTGNSFLNTNINCIPHYTRYITAANAGLAICAPNSPCVTNNIYIPDPKFKAALLRGGIYTNADGTYLVGETERYLDANLDREIQYSEALNLQGMNLNLDTPLDSLNGIEHFKNLKFLGCARNNISKLDLYGLDSLKIIIEDFNTRPFTVENITNHPNLEYLIVARNGNNLTSLDVSGCKKLQRLQCYENALTTLNIQGDTAIYELFCSNNQLTSLDLQGMTHLYNFICAGNQITALNLSSCRGLGWFDCHSNMITSLDFSNSPGLSWLHCENNLLTSLYFKNRGAYTNTYSEFLSGDGTGGFSGNPTLTYICGYDTDMWLLRYIANQNGYTNCTINSFCTPNGGISTCHAYYTQPVGTYSNYDISPVKAFRLSPTTSSYNRFLWQFGDGAVDSTHIYTSHTFNSIDSFNVCLTLYNDTVACSDTYCKKIFISNLTTLCTTDCIFPGDADSDGECNNTDVLAIGLMNGNTGSLRYGDREDWYPQSITNWTNTIPNTNTNVKHTDCDGNGMIDSADMRAIINNYKRTHNGATPANRSLFSTNGVPISVQFVQDTFSITPISDTIIADVFVGSSTIQATNFYGFATSIAYDPTIFRPVSIEYNTNSFMGDAAEVMVFGINNVPDHTYDIAVTRRTQTPVTGNGRVARIKGVIEEDVIGKEYLKSANRQITLGVQNTTAIDGVNIIIPIQNIGDTCQIKTITATENTTDLRNHIRVFPNPTPQNSLLNIETNGVTLKNIVLTNILGQTILNEKTFDTTKAQINTQSLSPAVYLLQITTDKGVFTQKIVVQ
jgi:hypothetical protein